MHHYSSFPLRNTPNIKTNHEPRHSGEMLQSPHCTLSPSGLGSHIWKPIITTLFILRRMLRSLCCAILTALVASMSSLAAKWLRITHRHCILVGDSTLMRNKKIYWLEWRMEHTFMLWFWDATNHTHRMFLNMCAYNCNLPPDELGACSSLFSK